MCFSFSKVHLFQNRVLLNDIHEYIECTDEFSYMGWYKRLFEKSLRIQLRKLLLLSASSLVICELKKIRRKTNLYDTRKSKIGLGSLISNHLQCIGTLILRPTLYGIFVFCSSHFCLFLPSGQIHRFLDLTTQWRAINGISQHTLGGGIDDRNPACHLVTPCPSVKDFFFSHSCHYLEPSLPRVTMAGMCWHSCVESRGCTGFNRPITLRLLPLGPNLLTLSKVWSYSVSPIWLHWFSPCVEGCMWAKIKNWDFN